MTARLALAIVASYFVGAIPTAFWVARAVKGIDLRTVGSKNLGSTNLHRVLGLKFAVPVALFDIMKGAVPVAVFGPWAGLGYLESAGLGLVAVLGHAFSVFVKFRGGKGVATGAGVVLAVAPLAFVAVFVTWLLVLAATRYVSLASIVAAVVLPLAVWYFHAERRELVPWFAGLAALIIGLHGANIRRLVNGTENRAGRGEARGGGSAMHSYNFTDRVRLVLQMAREEAARLGHEYVGTEHILLAIAREGEGVAATVLGNLGVKLPEIRDTVDGIVKRGQSSVGVELPYTSRAKKVLELSMMEARDLNHSYVGTEHLLLGLLREGKGIGAQVLTDAGVTLEQARAETLRLLYGSTLPESGTTA